MSLDARLFLIVWGRDKAKRPWYTLITHACNLSMNLLIMIDNRARCEGAYRDTESILKSTESAL